MFPSRIKTLKSKNSYQIIVHFQLKYISLINHKYEWSYQKYYLYGVFENKLRVLVIYCNKWAWIILWIMFKLYRRQLFLKVYHKFKLIKFVK